MATFFTSDLAQLSQSDVSDLQSRHYPHTHPVTMITSPSKSWSPMFSVFSKILKMTVRPEFDPIFADDDLFGWFLVQSS